MGWQFCFFRSVCLQLTNYNDKISNERHFTKENAYKYLYLLKITVTIFFFFFLKALIHFGVREVCK